MADGESVPNWPGPVTFNDEDPKGFATIFLTVPNMELIKSGVFGKQRPGNVAVETNFENRVIEIKVSFTEVGNRTAFEYKKNAPGDIDAKRCKISYKGNKIIVKVAKVKRESWASEERYLIKKPELNQTT